MCTSCPRFITVLLARLCQLEREQICHFNLYVTALGLKKKTAYYLDFELGSIIRCGFVSLPFKTGMSVTIPECLCLHKIIHMLKTSPQCEDIWKWTLWEMIRYHERTEPSGMRLVPFKNHS